MRFKGETEDRQSRNWRSTIGDEALVAIAQAGSHSAFVELFVRHRKTLFRTVQRITKNAHDTEDVLQDCSIKAFVHIKTFGGKAAFSTWLVRIAINTALMMLRKRGRVTVASLDDPVNSDRMGPWQIAEPSHNPEQELLEREMQFQIHQAVRCLPPSLRTVLDVHRLQDRPLRELASMTGLTVAATKSRLYRARLKVRDSVQRMRGESFESLH
jgi:RNA polymerase sigma-70 factor (ECF subfamily)